VKIKTLALCCAALVAVISALVAAQTPAQDAQATYKNAKAPVEQRVEDLLRRMTPQEKASMLAGSGWMESQSIERLGIPAIRMADGPLGVRSWRASSAETSAPGTVLPPVKSTSFPVGSAMAATWDPEIAGREGKVIAQETKALGRDMILGPTVNINRVPTWGRNFEGYGEDPYLAARLGVAFIKAVQAEKVIPSVKHFAANNQEFERRRIDEQISERALHEIYFPAFKAAVREANVWTVMSSYNKVNGLNASANPYLLRDTLKQRWGFQGFVISDWASTYGTEPSVIAGLDLEMPGGEALKRWFSTPGAKNPGVDGGWLAPEKVFAAVTSGKLPQSAVDDAVRRLLRVMFSAGLFDNPARGGELDTPEQRAVARTAATESIVLLKNAGAVLPLAAPRVRSLAVIGPNAAVARTGGGGSSLVTPNYSVAPLDGIRERAGAQVKVAYAQGVSMEGEEPEKETPDAAAKLRADAVALAKSSDAAVVVVGRYRLLEAEGFDIKTMDLPKGQDELIQEIAAVNKNTVVVLVTGAPVTMTRWLDRVPGVLAAWYGGQEGGHAIGDVLFGAANPSGKLPVTFPREFKDATAFGHYPGENLKVDYAEGIYVGYRGFEKKNVEPLFPFGHGLSYTTFEYADLKVTPAKATSGQPVRVSLRVRNGGKTEGAEVVQLYLNDPQAAVDRPPKELKGFQRVLLKPGESRTVEFAIDRDAMSYYSEPTHDWVAEPGAFNVLVGASSRDIRLKGAFELTK
jgi:beta-glucosidase